MTEKMRERAARRVGWMKRKNRLAAAVLSFVLALGLVEATGLAGNVTAQAEDVITLRVGWYVQEGFQNVDEDGDVSGYAYEYLQMLSSFGNFNFQYVTENMSFNECFKALKDNRIDLILGVELTADRMQSYAFSEESILTSSDVLSVRDGDERYTKGEYETYDGMVVGVIRGSQRKMRLASYARKKGFTYTTVEYLTTAEQEAALENGEVDAILTGDERALTGEWQLESFNSVDSYIVMRTEDVATVEKLDDAMAAINQYYPYWKEELHNTYFSTISENIQFSSDEKAYLGFAQETNHAITAIVAPNQAPYSYFEDGEAKGILPDYFALIMEKAGLEYEIIETGSREEYEAAIAEGDIDVIIDAEGNGNYIEKAGYVKSADMLSTSIATVYRRYGSENIDTVVLPKHGFECLEEVAENLGNVKIKRAANIEDGVYAVSSKQADAAIMLVYTAQEYIALDENAELTMMLQVDTQYQFNLAVRSDTNHVLASILIKCEDAIPEAELDQLVAYYSTYTYQNSRSLNLGEIITKYPYIIPFCSVIIVLMAVLLFMFIRQNHRAAVLERTKKDLDEALDKAKVANEAKTNFLYNMSHDIRTPMNAILGFTTLAKRDINKPSEALSSLNKVESSGQHLLGIINEILDMSRIESGKVVLHEDVMSIKTLQEETAEMIRGQMEDKQIDFLYTSHVDHEYVRGDHVRLSQIIINLLSNALKYTQKGGHVVYTIEETMAKEPKEGYAYYHIKVEDSGIGMSEDFLKRIFQPFERENTATVSGIQGTGLGLTITRNLITLMGGCIEVSSQKGFGSEFLVELGFPISAEEEYEKSEEINVEASFEGKKILLVEDNPLNRELATEVLQDAGFVIETACDGTEAVDLMKEKPGGTYDLILMDIQMPIMDGYEATRQIRALGAVEKNSIPIIAMTANAFEEDKKNAFEAGMNAHVAKPIDVEVLMETLKMMLYS